MSTSSSGRPGLWLLWRLNERRFDGYYALVVRAATEADARTLADSFRSDGPRGVWSDPALAACRVIAPRGRARVILAGGDDQPWNVMVPGVDQPPP